MGRAGWHDLTRPRTVNSRRQPRRRAASRVPSPRPATGSAPGSTGERTEPPAGVPARVTASASCSRDRSGSGRRHWRHENGRGARRPFRVAAGAGPGAHARGGTRLVGPRCSGSTLADLVHQVQLRVAPGDRVVVCGVGCGGPMSPERRDRVPAQHRGVAGLPLAGSAARAHGVPTHVDNDAKALALGEGWVGAAAGRRDYIGIVVSTGVGGGIVLDGRLLGGRLGNAGHIGHVVVVPEGRHCACGGRGCLEAEASGPAIAALTGRPADVAPPSMSSGPGPSSVAPWPRWSTCSTSPWPSWAVRWPSGSAPVLRGGAARGGSAVRARLRPGGAGDRRRAR